MSLSKDIKKLLSEAETKISKAPRTINIVVAKKLLTKTINAVEKAGDFDKAVDVDFSDNKKRTMTANFIPCLCELRI